jgi:hypothetical protein
MSLSKHQLKTQIVILNLKERVESCDDNPVLDRATQFVLVAEISM